MRRTAQIYQLALTANQTFPLLVEGGFYKLLSASGEVKISREGGSAIGPLQPGQGERVDFRRLTITDLSGTANNIEILVADDSFIDTRVYGAVQVIDGGRLLTMQDVAYVGAGSVAPVAGMFSMVELWNPPANTKYAAISRLIATTYSANTNVQLRPHNAALLTLGNAPQPKLVKTGFSNSVMQVRLDAAAAVAGGTVMGLWNQSASGIFEWKFQEPIILPPGQGLNVTQVTVNLYLGVAFDFYEFTP